MDCTAELRIIIDAAIKAKGLNRQEFGDLMDRSSGWVSKVLNGQQKGLSDDDVRRIEEVLGISLTKLGTKESANLSPLAIQISRMIETQPESALIIRALMSARKDRLERLARKRPEIGAEIIRAVRDHSDHPEKIADIAIAIIDGTLTEEA